MRVLCILHSLWMSAIPFHSESQNLAPNPSFEVYSICPPGVNTGNTLECTPWTSPYNTSDYFNGCANPIISVPSNFQGFQYAHTGVAYTGMYFHTIDFYREYIQAPLLQPLEADSCYLLGFWINLGNDGCGIDQAGAVLSVNPPSFNPLPTPQLNWSGEFLSDTANWVFVSGYYTAVGGEKYITIGNFHPMQTEVDPNCTIQFPWAYYYVDDVIVQKMPPQNFEIDLGGPVTACDSFVIDPGFPDAQYYWSNGSHGQTLTVYSSGTYSVTATYACTTFAAEIDVTVLAGAFFDIGPNEVTFCAGETYTISLDEDFGVYQWNDGSDDTEYEITTAGTYSVTLDYGCDVVSDTVVVNVTDPPAPLDLGMDTFFCDGDEIEFQLDPSLGDFEWQDHSTSSSYIIDEEGTYSLTITNVCGEETDEIEILVIVPPVFSLGPDSILLCDDEEFQIELDPTLGDFYWQDGSASSSYAITNTGWYSLTVSNPCGALSNDIYVSHDNFPVLDLGPDLQACPGDTLIFNGGNAQGDYIWQDGSTGSEYVVTTSGTYALTVSNDCGFNTGDINVSYQAPISPPDLGPDFTLCPGEQAVLHLNIPNASFLWNNNSTADSLVITTAGIYSVYVFNACESYRDTVSVTLQNNPPSVSLPADFYLCQGDTTILFAGAPNVAYQWNDGSQLPQLTVNAPGWYGVTVSNSCGTDHDSVFIADGGQPPMVSLGVDTAICAGNTFTITPVFSGVNSWTWQDGSTNSFFNVTTTGLVYVDVANNCGAANDSLLIGLLPAIPLLSLGPDTSLCPGESVTLSINVTSVDILWSDGSVNNNLTIADSAVVYASISNACGVSTDSVEVSLLAGPPVLDLGPDLSICPGETITLSANIADVDYLWQDGSINSSFQVTQGDTIALTITNSCGTDQDTVVIIESTQGPQVDLGPDLHACAGETITIPSNISGVSYLWQDGSTAPEYVASASGEIILLVSNLCGADSDTILVDISGVIPEPELGPDTTLCEGQSILLSAMVDPNAAVTWQDGSTNPSYLVNVEGTYSLRAMNSCGEGRDSILVSFMKGPDPFELGNDTLLCPGQSFVIVAPVTTFEKQWQDGSSGPTMVADDNITYRLIVRNACGEVSDSLKVAFDQHIPLVYLDGPLPWCPEDSISLDASQSFQASYLWSTGETTPSILASLPGIYSVDVAAMCASTSGQVELVLIDDCGIDGDLYIPNVFTPNDDNINDVFTIFTGLDVEWLSIHGTIYDRWGNLVFQSFEVPFTWDGKFHDEIMNPAVYVYVLEVRYKVENKEFESVLSGDVTLIR